MTNRPVNRTSRTQGSSNPNRTVRTRNVQKPKSTKRKVNRRNLWTLILVFVVCIEMIIGITGLFVLNSMLKDSPELNLNDFTTSESSHIYDSAGNEIADVGETIRENITYDQLSESIVDAFLAVEDSRFFSHNGFDLPRFTKSMIENVLSGSFSQGGSTFTMQLTKLTYFMNDEAGISRTRNVAYKVQQINLAIQLEKEIGKKEIFVMYLNKLNFGGTGNIRGIEKASEYYYGKHASELNLAESAMLAGVINSPYYYDPHNFLDYATTRRNTVLNLMKRHGYITDQECKLAKSILVEDTLIDPSSSNGGSNYQYQSYIDTVIKEAQSLTGMDPLDTAMDIYTAMDVNAQTTMDAIQAGEYEDIQYPDELMEIGATSINNQTGEIVAIAGGRNYGRGGSMLLNHAMDQYKQPGSSVKPLLDYSLAFEYLGWATDHVVTDRPIRYEGTDVIIKNANGQYYGQMSLKKAVGLSLNTPAIQALQEVLKTAGWETVTNYLTSLGFSQVSNENFDIGFAIGGSNFICTPTELAAAYQMTMNGGYYIQPHTITKIEFRDGKKEALTPTYEPVQVISDSAAYLTSQLMYDAVHTNYQNFLQILIRDGYATYGKTGTSDWGDEGLPYNIPSGASKDKWMVSQTTMYSTAVWVGYEKGVKDAGTYFDNAKALLNIPGHISDHILSALTDEMYPGEVAKPEGVSSITHILGTWPYAAPVEGMDGTYLTTGEIKNEFNTLTDPNMGAVEELSAFTANQNEDGTLNLTWAAYPDAGALTAASDTLDISLYDGEGNPIVWAEGARIFDYSWIFGPIRYKVRLSQNGVVVGELSSETETSNQGAALEPNTNTEACGYYGYENGVGASNEICVTFTSNGNSGAETPAQDGDGDAPAPTPEADYSTVPQTTNAHENLETAKAFAAHYSTTVIEQSDPSKAGTFQFFDANDTLLYPGTTIPAGVKIYYFTD